MLALTVVVRLRHEVFLRVHRLLGVAFGLGAAQALRVEALRVESPWLRGWLLVVTVTGVVTWLYRSGLGRTLVPRRFYEVSDVRVLHPTVTS